MGDFYREPIALFRQIKEKKKPSYLLDNLKSAYPRELKIGAAINPNYGLNKEIKVQLRRGKQGKLEYFSNN